MNFIIFLLLCSVPAYSQNNNQLINWFAGADIVGTTGNSDANLGSDFYVREFEFSAYSNIDQTFEGVLTLAYHKELEANEEHIEVHEGFLFSSKLLPLSTIKVGKFFLGFGRLNRFHRHDWAFTEAPVVQKSFFGNEGAKDTGIEIKRNLPSLMSSITLGVTSGNEFNHSEEHGHDDEDEHEHGNETAHSPTVYGRFAKFVEFSTMKGMDIGLNVIYRKDSEGIESQYSGVDFVFKNREGKFLKDLIQAEVWMRNQKHTESGEVEKHEDLGGYLYYERGLDQHHSLGLRLDYFSKDHSDEEHGHEVDGLEIEDDFTSISAAYIYTNSEFMRTRFTIEHGTGIHVEDDESVDSYSKAMLQFVFSIGAHPAHVY